jgi:endonuclease/exonuclease/phosphatase family metal-dependent hydrolase
MKLVTWNVQWCCGVDLVVDPARIVAEAKRLADFDVLCLQEIADNYPAPRLAGSAGEDQFALLASLLPGYTAVPGVAVDHPADASTGGRRRFGNLVFSRLPVRQVYRHLLPFPCDPGVPGMPRIAIEAVVAAPFGDVRVLTTHLEYYSARQRMAQVDALRTIYADGHAHARDGRVTMSDGGPFQTFVRPTATVITGDFNFEPDAPEHARMRETFADGTPALTDAWRHAHPGTPHPPTFCIYQKFNPGDPELHCDFVWLSPDMRDRLAGVEVDTATQASDHQPVVVTFG